MPFPLVPIVIFGVIAMLGLGGLAVAIPWLARKISGKRVAILGGQKVGKTTLLHILREGKLPNPVKRTVDSAVAGEFSMEVGGKAVNFHVPHDLPGHGDPGYAAWRKAFSGANYVWYLFRSDLIAQGDAVATQDVKDHLDMFKQWSNTAKSKPPTVILVGTWADKDLRFEKDAAGFKRKVGAVDAIKAGQVKLGNAGLVVGSLLNKRGASKLINSLGSNLR